MAVEQIDARPYRGRTELILRPGPQPPLQGWRLRAQGRLRRPSPGPHPLLRGSAERLAQQGSWSQLIVQNSIVLNRSWTPLADLRRRIADRLRAVAGDDRGGLMAALVLGRAQVPLPSDLQQAFRVAGLSHALAASGFHLSVYIKPYQA